MGRIAEKYRCECGRQLFEHKVQFRTYLEIKGMDTGLTLNTANLPSLKNKKRCKLYLPKGKVLL